MFDYEVVDRIVKRFDPMMIVVSGSVAGGMACDATIMHEYCVGKIAYEAWFTGISAKGKERPEGGRESGTL